MSLPEKRQGERGSMYKVARIAFDNAPAGSGCLLAAIDAVIDKSESARDKEWAKWILATFEPHKDAGWERISYQAFGAISDADFEALKKLVEE